MDHEYGTLIGVDDIQLSNDFSLSHQQLVVHASRIGLHLVRLNVVL